MVYLFFIIITIADYYFLPLGVPRMIRVQLAGGLSSQNGKLALQHKIHLKQTLVMQMTVGHKILRFSSLI